MSALREGDAIDGRSARRERNRNTALDAAFELFSEGNALPSIDDVAARSGVSLRSLYRYFKDAHDLHLLALVRRAEVAEPLYRLERQGEGSLEERIGRVVEQRLRLHDEIAPAIRMAFAIAPRLPAIHEQVQRRKRLLSSQLRAQFAPELDPLPDPLRASVMTCVEVLCQFESVERMRSEDDLDRDRAGAALQVGLRAVLAAPGPG